MVYKIWLTLHRLLKLLTADTLFHLHEFFDVPILNQLTKHYNNIMSNLRLD